MSRLLVTYWLNGRKMGVIGRGDLGAMIEHVEKYHAPDAVWVEEVIRHPEFEVPMKELEEEVKSFADILTRMKKATETW